MCSPIRSNINHVCMNYCHARSTAKITLNSLQFLKFCPYDICEIVNFHTCTTFVALSNETKLSSLAAIVWEIEAFPTFLLFNAFKNLKIAITPEMLIAQYLMTPLFSGSFRHAFKLCFSELASCHGLGDICISFFC